MSSDSVFDFSFKSNHKMTERKEFCLGQIFGVFLFCGGFVGGIIIGIYVFNGGKLDEVFCKNLPKLVVEDATRRSRPLTTTEKATTSESPGMFTYSINNQIQEPFFNHSIVMVIEPGDAIIYYMEKAVNTHKDNFTGFTATYFSGLGFFIDSINKLAGNFEDNQTYWQILNDSVPLSVGVSTYIPMDGDIVLLNFTVYTNHTK